MSESTIPTVNGKPLEEVIKELQERFHIVGREIELKLCLAANLAKKHLLLEGDVGVGKTTMAHALANYFSLNLERVDGDDRYSAARLVGHFDPPMVIQKGYTWESFVRGPLVSAMQNGSILFLNELNRMPEGTQNVLLAAMDEGVIMVPKLGIVEAKDGFFIISAMNPQEFVATTPLSEALKDRFAWIRLQYQTEEEERQITQIRTGVDDEQILNTVVRITRRTRDWNDLRRGSSIRGSIDYAGILQYLDKTQPKSWIDAGIMALATKIELEDGIDRRVEEVLTEIINEVLAEQDFL
ncbi:MAG: MoxR family ATPase [Candidatus Heimdallarchaeota archaeon]|nr:MoxR family ATPase [Candidatus Heimdallarchaeota archaeon]MDH5646077.1 MoxR family ATPase [Candidatus Heimdallarchaeota archaeon]